MGQSCIPTDSVVRLDQPICSPSISHLNPLKYFIVQTSSLHLNTISLEVLRMRRYYLPIAFLATNYLRIQHRSNRLRHGLVQKLYPGLSKVGTDMLLLLLIRGIWVITTRSYRNIVSYETE